MINLGAMKRGDVPPRCEGVTWLYVLGAGNPPVASKVGIAIDLYVRLKRTAYRFKRNAFPVGLYCAYAIEEHHPRATSLESKTHGFLTSWAFGHPGGDWFLLEPKNVDAAVRTILFRNGVVDAQRFPTP